MPRHILSTYIALRYDQTARFSSYAKHVTGDVLTDRELLGVVLHNLIDNAIKATIYGFIQVSSFHQGNEIQLVVADRGPGLPTALLNWLNANEHEETSSLPEQYNGLIQWSGKSQSFYV